MGSMEAQALPLNAPLADSNIEPAEARSQPAETAGLRRSVESQSANPERESVPPTATPAPVQAMPASVAEPAAASQVAEPAPQDLTAQPARMPEVARPEAKSSNATKDQSVTATGKALMDLLPQQAEEPPVAEPRTIQVTTTPTAATETSRRSEDVVNNLNAEPAPVQLPSKASAQAASPAAMPEAMNQALKVLAAPPVLSLESTPTPASSPVPAPEGNREPSPNQGAPTDQNAVLTNVKPEAVAKATANHHRPHPLPIARHVWLTHRSLRRTKREATRNTATMSKLSGRGARPAAGSTAVMLEQTFTPPWAVPAATASPAVHHATRCAMSTTRSSARSVRISMTACVAPTPATSPHGFPPPTRRSSPTTRGPAP